MSFLTILYASLFYFASAVIILGVGYKIWQYATIPAPLKIPTMPAPVTKSGVVVRMAEEVVLFKSLFKSNKWIWIFGWMFHFALLLVLMRHLRYFTDPVWWWVNLIQPFGMYAGYAMVIGLLGLLGRPEALGEAFHITNDEWLTWNRIFSILGGHLGCEPRLMHLPSRVVALADPEIGAGLLGDKSHSMIFDNSKLRRVVPEFEPAIPFAEGARDIVEWYDEDPARQVVDPAFDALQDRLAALYTRLMDLARG